MDDDPSGWSSERLDALWDFSDPSGSESRFRQAEAEGAGDEARTQIARALGLQKRFDEALAELRSIPLERASPLLKSRWNLEFGRVHNSSGDPEAAEPYFLEALREADVAGNDTYAIDAIHMLAIVSPTEASLGWFAQGLARCRASRDPRARNWEGPLLNNAGWTLYDAGRYAEALPFFEEALAFRRAAGVPDPIRIAEEAVAECRRALDGG